MRSFLRFVLPVFGLMGARLSGAAFGFLSQILLARTFSAHDVGIAFLAMSIASFVSLLITCGYTTLALTYLARYLSLGRKLLVEGFLSAMRRDMAIASVIVLLLALAAFWLLPMPDGVDKAVLFGCLAALPLAAIRLNNSVANAQRRFALSYVPDFVLRPGLLLAFVACIVLFNIQRNIDYVLIALVVLTIAVAVGQAVLLGTDNALVSPARKPSRDLRGLYRSKAAAMLVIAIVAQASADLVVMLGGIFFPPSEVAVLGVAVRLSALVGFFSMASQQFVLRDLTGAIAKSTRSEVDALLLRTNVAGLATMTAAILFVVIFGGLLLGIFGSEYTAGYWPLLLFMVGQGLRTSSGMNGHLLALGGHQIRSAVMCLGAVAVLVLLSAFFAPLWGITGIALASVIAEAFWAIGLAALTQRLEGRRGDIFAVLTLR